MRSTLIALGFLVASAGSAFAQSTGSEGYFTIHNNTGGNVLVGFYTNDGSGWSDNWLDEDIAPNASLAVEFIADTGECDQLFQAGWLGSDQDSEILDEPHRIDICDANNVYLGDNNVTYD
ncbi:MAG: hypothetical protein AAF478_11045 [Pseudomonadota bacterium]